MGKGAHLSYIFEFLGVNGRQIYPFYSFTPPSKHDPSAAAWLHMADCRQDLAGGRSRVSRPRAVPESSYMSVLTRQVVGPGAPSSPEL